MSAEIEKYHLRVITVNGLIKNVTGILWCLETLPSPSLDATSKPEDAQTVNCIQAPVWFLLHWA